MKAPAIWTARVGIPLFLFVAGCTPPDNATRSPAEPPSSTSPKASARESTPIASAELAPASGSNVRGIVNFIQDKDKVRVEATITGLTPGKHGFHIHEKGDCSAPDASSAGGHFNPTGMPHAGPGEHQRHVGDFGNVEADASGQAKYAQSFSDLKFDGDASIIGKGVIVHEKADDLKTQPSGDAGGRVACGVIAKK
jgi:Cu-Zn family superoxide dismutase